MPDLFSPPTDCPVCGEEGCGSRHVPVTRLPHARERFWVPHVVAPEDVYSEPDPVTGAGVKLIARGDPVSPEVAARYGWDRVRDPGAPPPRRRLPPPPRSGVA